MLEQPINMLTLSYFYGLGKFLLYTSLGRIQSWLRTDVRLRAGLSMIGTTHEWCHYIAEYVRDPLLISHGSNCLCQLCALLPHLVM